MSIVLPYSCLNAVAKIERFTHPVAFLPRPSTLDRDVIFVPYRFASDDGYCAVDLTIAADDHITGDVRNGLAVGRGADQLWKRCVAFGRGGYTRGFSK